MYGGAAANRNRGERKVPGRLSRLEERQAEITMYRFLLTSMKKRHAWDRVKCAIATGIPAFWILILFLRPHIPTTLSDPFPAWLAAGLTPLLEDSPAIWTIAVSLAIAGFQWYNIAYYQRVVIPLVREMYDRAVTRRDPQLLSMLGEALRLSTLRGSFRNVFRDLFSKSR